ncbi:MAG: zinc ABC transporter substrate-binding protein [Oscillospiraceae bacterium]|nr:zinc ABC transporter substrate-binding protein [Oscillospiraceae bacterium]
MKTTARILLLLLAASVMAGCAPQTPQADIAATTLPVYEFTSLLCRGTDLTVTQLVTENVSCLHDYSLSVKQVKSLESAQVVVLSGGGLEDFMADVLDSKDVIDSSAGIPLLENCHDHDHEHHHHEADAHFWLSPDCAKIMVNNICQGLIARYPQHEDQFRSNLADLLGQLDALKAYASAQLGTLSCREMITFHDGFSYFAQAFDLHILAALEEESGSEASASELKELITMTKEHNLPAIFTEANGSDRSAKVIAEATDAKVYQLSMVMSGESYFTAMYRNIDTVKEALG